MLLLLLSRLRLSYIDLALTNAYKDQIDEWLAEYADDK